MTVEPDPSSKQAKLEKNIALVKLFFQMIAYLATLIFLGELFALMALYGFDVTKSPYFTAHAGTNAGIIAIPLFAVVLLCALVVGIIQLRDNSLKEEDQLKEFKLVNTEAKK